MPQDYYNFIRSLNDGLFKTSQIESELKALHLERIGLRHHLQLGLSNLFLTIGYKIRPKIILSHEREAHIYNKGSYAS